VSRQDSARDEAKRTSGRTADQIRACGEPDNGASTRSRCARDAARPRRRGGRMRNRRQFITLLGGAAIAWPLAARAQQSGKMPRVGVLVSLSAPHPFTEALRSGMHDLGYVEGRNIAIEWRYADAQFSRAAELAAELVRLQVDVIAAYHTPAGTT